MLQKSAAGWRNMRQCIKQGAVFVLVFGLLVSTVSIQAMASTMEDSIRVMDDFYGEEAAYEAKTVYEYEDDVETEDEPDDELDEEDEIHEDVLDYSETSEYWYNGSKVQPDKNGFVVCDGVLIGYEGTKTKITIPSHVTKIYGLFNTANRNPYFEVKIPESVQEISNSFNYHVTKLTFAERGGKKLVIGKNCFNNIRVSRIDLPEGTISIGKNCFSGMSFVGVPQTVKEINGWKQYEGKPCILCKKGSYAEKYAKEQKKNYSNQFAPYVGRPRKTIYATVGKWLCIECDNQGFDDAVKFQSSDSSILKVQEYIHYGDVKDLRVYGKKPGRATVTLSAEGYASSFDVVVLKHTENNAVKLILHNSTNGSMSNVQKAYHIGEYLAGYVTYDYTGLPSDFKCLTLGKYSPHTAQGALLDKLAVCDGISYAYQKILKEVGIESRIITGNNGGPHAWTLVKIGKKWSHVDVTNGLYFKTDKQMRKYCWWNQSNYPKADYKPPKGFDE